MGERPARIGFVQQDNALLVNDRAYWRHCRKILKAQHRLREACSDEAFDRYMDLEEIVNERLAWMLARVARWGSEEGRQRTRPSF